MERVDLNGTFGAAHVGELVMLVLYGITTLQTYMYFVRYPKDTPSTKLLVTGVWCASSPPSHFILLNDHRVLDTFHVMLVCHAMYHYVIINYANPQALDDGIWTLFASIGVNVVIAFVTQCFFTQRVHILSGKKWWLTGVTSLAVLAHFGFGMETTAELIIKHKLSRLPEITLIAVTPFAVTAVASDIIITVALCVLLWNSRTGFRQTNVLVNYLMIYAINRCLLTSLVAVVEVIMFATMPHSFWYLAFDFVIGKLYANSLLATLNTRDSLRGKANDPETERGSEDITSLSLGIRPVTSSMVSSSIPSRGTGVHTSFSRKPPRVRMSDSDIDRTLDVPS
ncbi:hypothetical protein BD410DRAFT_594062 [Rickenella mellea]|uniref:DUF6534 domain-containing protein n=1 Tax=Rickenella mellea TaxID=50990 RepID=A0A4Y7QEH1_9AGAM|nr:hypothetical protein BD410DRAFT_594062 [Rickenella mellea]